MDMLLDWNTRLNLTAITQPTDVWQKHFADSLSLCRFIKPATGPLLDIGTGAGFPGIPLKIACPGLSVTLMDSLRKRVAFLQHATDTLGLQGIECVHAHTTEFARQHAGQYAYCTARAVAKLDKLATWALPFLRKGGLFLAMKGPDMAEELAAAAPTIQKYGGRHAATHAVELAPGLVHTVVVIEKIK